MPPWPILIIFAVLASCAVVVVGNLWVNWKKRASASAEPADDALTATESTQPEWDGNAAHTDSWIWR